MSAAMREQVVPPSHGSASKEPCRPRVTVKLAQSLDGRIATSTGHSQWISGEDSLRFAHELRAAHDAVLVGVGTVMYDDPRLTVRRVAGKDPLRIVADTNLRTPLSSHVLSDEPHRTLILAGEGASPETIAAVTDLGAQVLLARRGADGRLDLADALSRLVGHGVGSLMVEGGAAIVTSLLRDRLVDRLVISIAPKLVGAGLEAIGDLGIRQLGDALTFSTFTIRQLGPDVIFDGELESSLAKQDHGQVPVGQRR